MGFHTFIILNTIKIIDKIYIFLYNNFAKKRIC